MQAYRQQERGPDRPFWRQSAILILLAAVLFLVAGGSSATMAAGEGAEEPPRFVAAGDASRTRVVLRFDRDPAMRWFLLRGPHRLVLDFPQASLDLDDESLEPLGMIAAVRYGTLEAGRQRVIITFDGPFAVQRIDVIENETGTGHRLVADVVAASDDQFERAMAEQVESTAGTQATRKGDRLGIDAGSGPRRPRIVIDAGHGGIDTGAEGVTGTLEKTITLAFALELKKRLEDSGRFDVFLTRDRDIFLMLDERVRIARQHEADLMISVHADAIRIKNVRGATVYTVSDTPSDPEAAAKAARENLADSVAGVVVEDAHSEVADILADLVRRETESFSIRFARSLVGELSTTIQMIGKNPHRFAGFKVLTAPDVPSVLLELGYLSNADDEALLRDAEWRTRATASIATAIDRFVAARFGE